MSAKAYDLSAKLQSCTSSEYVCGVFSASLQDAGGIALRADFTTVFVVLVDVAALNATVILFNEKLQVNVI
ncbi:hypothetical protein PF002_g1312 [Phytophthora fragariae]|uniref:Uncharacterized protein n=1 Tax=Phytophthora fragariae TaxID=53985 RepID=A0A6A3MFX8_9STRA|nr:hypothetical protein PF011_g921 [Phytophthora fragariae]KAE9250398.1 hypothetical protein PF004_g2957 [Phytophthora fragariae]KAE9257115.1 hypothetical protein PF002_g1312 [Phytophthora fragariae]